MEQLRTFKDIEVKLVGAIRTPYELAVATARTCYSGKGIVSPDVVSSDERSIELRDRIASSTLEAGHLTTRQHAHFVFAISGVSRQFIWSFLHSHPFYNSEQVSQRYVRVKPGSFVKPELTTSAEKIYLDTINDQMSVYEKLILALKTPLSGDFYERFPARKKTAEKWNSSIDKRAFEVARYVLAVGTTAYLYHTVSALTLLRYARLVNLFDTSAEQREVVSQMLARVRELDPLFDKELRDPVPLEKTLEYQFVKEQTGKRVDSRFIDEFDRELGGKTSKLIDYSERSEAVLAASVRTTLGRTKAELSDEAALSLVLDPKNNPILADPLNSATLDKLNQLLHHVHFTFQKKLSHTADSQDQRHRMVPASRPLLVFHYSGKPDYITPFGITQSQEASDLYHGVMERSFAAVNRLLEMGIPQESAFYLLPNSLSIRMISSGDLLNYQHKWMLRTCYNAQEEIFRASLDEIQQVREVLPKIAEHMRAPCYLRLRAGHKPFCPEGDRFCGLPVWKYDISQYERKSL